MGHKVKVPAAAVNNGYYYHHAQHVKKEQGNDSRQRIKNFLDKTVRGEKEEQPQKDSDF
jgi:hypothetical protein